MARSQRRGRRTGVALVLGATIVAAVAIVRRQRLDAATRDFHQRHGPLDPTGPR